MENNEYQLAYVMTRDEVIAALEAGRKLRDDAPKICTKIKSEKA